ncbi:recombinase family protein [Aeoliella sp.]|uniref:recombinase family protein n=1 Tax=Aeoliella sp. TaxID=2795800 RepID=UPI003CCB7E8E
MARRNVVWVRKSTDAQEDKAQVSNIKKMLAEQGIEEPHSVHWFHTTASRRVVRNDSEFKRLLALVEQDQIGIIFVEKANRFGQTDSSNWFGVIGILRDHDTELWDLDERKELTSDDIGTEITGLVGAHTNKKQLEDTATFATRTKVDNFKTVGSWPTGCHPFGYGKVYFVNAQLRWEFHPSSRTIGRVYLANANGKLTESAEDTKIPPRAKKERGITKLIPHRDKQYVKSVKLIFDWFTRAGLSRRAIAKRLNDEGRQYYAKPFTPALVREILLNPAYAGDTHFGKTQSGVYCSFDKDGNLLKFKDRKRQDTARNKAIPRDESERMVMPDTHKPLIDRKTWELAQAKITSEQSDRKQQRTSFAPRNPNYYLKQLLVCGHCGKGMIGRTENGNKVVYVCSSYVNARTVGNPQECGYHRIAHDDAERMLLTKAAELGIPVNVPEGIETPESTTLRLEHLQDASDEALEQMAAAVKDGTIALTAYFKEHYDLTSKELSEIKRCADEFYNAGELSRRYRDKLPVEFRDFKKAIADCECNAIAKATKQVEGLKDKHTKYTIAKADASDRQRVVLSAELEKIEAELDKWESRTMPLSDKIRAIHDADDSRIAEYGDLLVDWPNMEARAKGEALRRLFEKLILYWNREWHAAEAKPSRPRKTDRPGRWTYTIDAERIEWGLQDINLKGCA